MRTERRQIEVLTVRTIGTRFIPDFSKSFQTFDGRSESLTVTLAAVIGSMGSQPVLHLKNARAGAHATCRTDNLWQDRRPSVISKQLDIYLTLALAFRNFYFSRN